MFILAMAIFGTLGLFVRNIQVTSGELALLRSLMALALIGTYFLLSKRTIPLRSIGKELPLLLASGVAMGFNWILLFQAYRYTTVSVATISYYFAPVIVTVLSPILFRERVRGKQWLCFVMSTIGILLITGLGSVNNDINLYIGIGYGLGAACLYATVVLLNKYIKSVEGLYRTFLQFLAAALVLIPYVLLTTGINLSVLDLKGTVSLLVVGIIHTGITYCMYFSALKELPGQKAAILSYIDPLVAVIISVSVLGEAIAPLQILGGALVLGFTLYNELGA